MKRLFLLLFLFGCADEYQEIHSISFNGGLDEDKAGVFTVRSHYGKVRKYSNADEPCEKVIHRGQRSYVVPCDY